MITVTTLEEKDHDGWDDYVRSHEDGSFFHLSPWQAICEKGAGLKTAYLIAKNKGVICGVLPLTYHQSPFFGRAVKSLAFGVEGGPLASNAETRQALDDKAWELAKNHGAAYLEYRSLKAQHQDSPDWHVKDQTYARFRRPILATEDENILALPNKQRPTVRKGIKAGLTLDFGDDLAEFYRHYSASVHRLGTPIFAKKYFQALLYFLPQAAREITIIRAPKGVGAEAHGFASGQSLGALMTFYYHGVALPYYMGSIPAARSVAVNDFMLFKQLVRAGSLGCHTYDLGRSKIGTGSYNFKKKLGYIPENYAYEYRMAAGQNMPDMSPKNPKYQMMIKIWQTMPLFMANIIGPWVSKDLG